MDVEKIVITDWMRGQLSSREVEGEKVTDYQSLNNFEGEMIIQMGKGSFFKIVK